MLFPRLTKWEARRGSVSVLDRTLIVAVYAPAKQKEAPLGIFPAGLSFFAGAERSSRPLLLLLRFFLEIHPKLGIGPILLAAGDHFLLGLPTGKQVPTGPP